MTDFPPIDSDHLSDEEFMTLCPQGEHAPGPEPLSPAAQAVFNAAWADTGIILGDREGTLCAQLAAALRAAADQVVPSPCFASDDVIHERILAIAAELEGAQ